MLHQEIKRTRECDRCHVTHEVSDAHDMPERWASVEVSNAHDMPERWTSVQTSAYPIVWDLCELCWLMVYELLQSPTYRVTDQQLSDVRD